MRHDEQHAHAANQRDEALESLQQRQTYLNFIRECQSCQQEVEPDWLDCAHCGTRLETKCPGCGQPLPPAGAQLCPSCGLAIPPLKA